MKHYPFYIFLFSQNSYQIAIFLTVSALWKAFQPFVDISLPYSSLCGSSRTICRCLFPEARILLRLQSYRQVSLPLSTTLLPLHQSHPIYKVQTYHLLLRKAGNIRSTLPDLQLLWTHTDHTVLYMLQNHTVAASGAVMHRIVIHQCRFLINQVFGFYDFFFCHSFSSYCL